MGGKCSKALGAPGAARRATGSVSRTRLRKLYLAAAGGGPGANATADVRNHDARGRLAAHLARLIDRLVERDLHPFRELDERLRERRGLDLEPERQHASGR